MKRLIIILICLCAAGAAFAQTPVEKVITKYAGTKGSKDFIASGGEMILATCQQVLADEFPQLYAGIQVMLPDENTRRVGQSVAAASLPDIRK